MFKTWEAEEVLKCSLWRARFDSYSGKPLTPKKLNCQVAMPLKCILGLFKLFHARLLGLLLHLFLSSFINVTQFRGEWDKFTCNKIEVAASLSQNSDHLLACCIKLVCPALPASPGQQVNSPVHPPLLHGQPGLLSL